MKYAVVGTILVASIASAAHAQCTATNIQGAGTVSALVGQSSWWSLNPGAATLREYTAWASQADNVYGYGSAPSGCLPGNSGFCGNAQHDNNISGYYGVTVQSVSPGCSLFTGVVSTTSVTTDHFVGGATANFANSANRVLYDAVPYDDGYSSHSGYHLMRMYDVTGLPPTGEAGITLTVTFSARADSQWWKHKSCTGAEYNGSFPDGAGDSLNFLSGVSVIACYPTGDFFSGGVDTGSFDIHDGKIEVSTFDIDEISNISDCVESGGDISSGSDVVTITIPGRPSGFVIVTEATSNGGGGGSMNKGPAWLCGRPHCNADFNGDGEVTDADIEAFWDCFAHDICCFTCASPDVNDDGEITDADIEAFFRVLAGGPC